MHGVVRRSLPLAWLVIIGLPVVHGAEGTRLIGTGPVQVGTAGAGVASPQNSSWLSLNPAGLVEVSNRVDVSTDIINGRVEVTPKGISAVANTANGTLDDSVIVLAPMAGNVGQIRGSVRRKSGPTAGAPPWPSLATTAVARTAARLQMDRLGFGSQLR
jgi:hypothetical protein